MAQPYDNEMEDHHTADTDSSIRKYYIGAEHIASAISRGGNASITRATIGEAVEDARKKLTDSSVEVVIIVEIIRIVRRKEPPIIVEEV